MSCFLRHKWSKWKKFTKNMHIVDVRMPEKRFDDVQSWQTRECLACGYVQEEKI